MREESRRQKKIASLIQEALGPLLITEFQPESGGLVTVTRVEVQADLRSACVYLSVLGPADPAEALARLESRAGQMRRLLASAVKLKYNPQLIFRLDPSAAEIERIERILEGSKKEDGRSG